MNFSGLADEAHEDIKMQIAATRQLGWKYFEFRRANGKNISNMTEAEFKFFLELIKGSGVKISCFASRVANFNIDPRDEKGFEATVKELKTALPRMQQLDIKYIRGMSFGVVKDMPFDCPEIEKLVFKKVKELVKLCEGYNIIYLHENCMNYGGQSYFHMLKLHENINSDYFRVLFDTGNPVFTWNRIDRPPASKQSSWEYYSKIKHLIEYVHIKDGIYLEETGETFPRVRYTFPGQGHGDVRRIVEDLLLYGYDGFFSIEPHLKKQLNTDRKDARGNSELRYWTYIEYGRQFQEIVKKNVKRK